VTIKGAGTTVEAVRPIPLGPIYAEAARRRKAL